MMNDWHMTLSDSRTVVAVAAALTQIVLFSFLLPWLRWRRLVRIKHRYPLAEHPRLHRMFGATSGPAHHFTQILAPLIGFLGLSLLVWALRSATPPITLARWAYLFMLVQLVPFLPHLPLYLRVRRALRTQPPPVVRTAELSPRRITNYVSTLDIALALCGEGAFAIVCALYLPAFSGRILAGTVALVVINVLLLARIFYRLRGNLRFHTADTRMSTQDRKMIGSFQMRVLFRYVTGYSVLSSIVVLTGAGKVSDPVYVFVVPSLFIQMVFLFFSIATSRFSETVDLSVYQVNRQAPG
jgi:hypothetical protein